jgi:hypothetical protein
MIRDLKCFYVAIKNNEVICFETNLKLFIEKFKNIEPKIKSYSHYLRAFNSGENISFVNDKKETYFFQKLI